MKSVKLTLFISNTLFSSLLFTMNGDKIVPDGTNKTDTPAPRQMAWATLPMVPAADLRATLETAQKQARRKATSAAAATDSMPADVSPVLPTSPSPKSSGSHSTSPFTGAVNVDSELSHTSRLVATSPSASFAGAGSRVDAGDTDRGYDSETETFYTGRHPDISTQRGDYHPGTGLLGYFFPVTFENLRTGKKVPVRNVEKSAAETSRNLFSPEEVALFAKLAATQHPEMGLPFWGNLHSTCKANKKTQARDALAQLRSIMTQVRLSKEGEKATLDAYGNVNGSGRTSPLADYGIGRRHKDDEVEATLQFVKKLFQLEKTEETEKTKK